MIFPPNKIIFHRWNCHCQPSATEEIMCIAMRDLYSSTSRVYRCSRSTTMRRTHQVRKYARDDLARLISIIMLGTSSVDLPREKFSGSRRCRRVVGTTLCLCFLFAAIFYNFNAFLTIVAYSFLHCATRFAVIVRASETRVMNRSGVLANTKMK